MTGTEDGGFILSVDNQDVGTYRATVPGSGATSGLHFEVNANYLVCAVEAQGKVDNVKLSFCEPNRDGAMDLPMMLNGGAVTTVIVPLRTV